MPSLPFRIAAYLEVILLGVALCSRMSVFAAAHEPGLLLRCDPFLHDLAVGIGDDHEATTFVLYHLNIARFALRHVIGPCAASAPKGV